MHAVLCSVCSVSPGDIPSLAQLGVDASALASASTAHGAAARLRGGESEALRRLTEFAAAFRDTGGSSSRPGRSQPAGGGSSNFCCKISPWLALGCLSPRQLYQQLTREASAQAQQRRLQAPGTEGDAGERPGWGQQGSAPAARSSVLACSNNATDVCCGAACLQACSRCCLSCCGATFSGEATPSILLHLCCTCDAAAPHVRETHACRPAAGSSPRSTPWR